MAEATARLRKAFRYPADADVDENEPAEGIDEQEQERVVATLSTHDYKSTAAYRRIFLAIPTFTLCYYFSALGPVSIGIHPSAHPLLWLSSILSAGLSLFLIWDVHVQGDASNEHKPPGGFLGRTGDATSRLLNGYHTFARSVGWARQRAAWIDGVVSTATFMGAWWSASNIEVGPGEISGAWLMALPALLTFLVAAVVQHELQPIDVRGLQKLKYEYKGA
ncbi:MAG: hypothetical protein M1831_003339 [Alyxoria varia]|nr:MAG: hypothetical protein M1831_003339 [Alyxoria varia]